jgi:hypothetical protein
MYGEKLVVVLVQHRIGARQESDTLLELGEVQEE